MCPASPAAEGHVNLAQRLWPPPAELMKNEEDAQHHAKRRCAGDLGADGGLVPRQPLSLVFPGMKSTDVGHDVSKVLRDEKAAASFIASDRRSATGQRRGCRAKSLPPTNLPISKKCDLRFGELAPIVQERPNGPAVRRNDRRTRKPVMR
jgi:hypothetical protein